MIVSYNNSVFKRDVFDNVPDIYKNQKQYSDKLLDDLNSFVGRYDIFFDRSALLPNVYNLTSNPKFPYIDNYRFVPLETLVMNRAKEILSRGKRVNIWWSGGIDSTCMLSAFITMADNKDQITIQLNHTSIIESGTIFERYIRKNYNWVLKPLTTIRNAPKDELSISGYIANQVMGQGSTNHHWSLDMWEKPWRDFIGKHERMKPKFIDYIEPALKAYPGKLETFFDYQLFYMLFFRWNQDYYLPIVRKFRNEMFYCADEFQQWSAYSDEPKYGNGLMKLPMKNIIRKVFPDDDYYYKKRTNPSHFLVGIPQWTFVLESGEVVKIDTDKTSLDKEAEICSRLDPI